MTKLTVGVVATSRKENEQRLPIHPQHLGSLEAEVRSQMYFETGYGTPFGMPDNELARQSGGIRTREELFAECDVILLFKPVLQDFMELREEQILWGCPHFLQDEKATQVSIDRRLTVIAMEAMVNWSEDGTFQSSIGPKMGEMAGYCSVTHALACVGRTGRWGPPLRAAVIGYGSTGIGAVDALRAQGITDIRLVTQRPPSALGQPLNGVDNAQLVIDDADGGKLYAASGNGRTGLAQLLGSCDVIVNCVRQNPDAPLVFLTEEQATALKPGALIVDVSCDYGMGFSWARPTSFTRPLHHVSDTVRYHAVDHSPSYLWASATWVLSEAILPYLGTIVSGEAHWASNKTVDRAVEVRRGMVQNPQILSFQDRSPEYPHTVL
ncbi:alanine dehydrogenase [Streptomyces avermitilis]|uniref:Alanine dehydrogenase n=2 Tax=Streptomyces avermitilis TaxID=33903 RepID=A0A4D4N9C9_STRAX|nr:alanine dehydrogenase [Streptomyces avermitilis]KUN47766.1 alanine dehydrogenase [Streptomyces avermitilis]BAU77523.1 putative alanine dehydrogenase [Streptomyces avermitilis MA-4680 = NBRC 14893]BBJ56259.1 alanine dehydrogenase [Streptomyces avermitilis]GDY70191.1 alanine dehydrogenase [Streptomyces avermitilis]GDY80494.1 alanine dehydrogenase [Streptomyces avermitilis]